MKMMSIDEYKNQVEMLKIALEFYGKEENYQMLTTTANTQNHRSNVLIDGGYQARYALETLNNIIEVNDEMVLNYDKIINETIESIEKDKFTL